MSRCLSLSWLAVFALSGCVPRPKQDYRLEQIAGIESLEEIMRVQAQDMDPLFAVRTGTAFTAAEFASMARAAQRLEATSRTLQERFAQQYPARFGDLVSAQAEAAGKLLGAAEAGRAPEAAASLQALKGNCGACHHAFR